jgi:uncharacterized membrane protein
LEPGNIPPFDDPKDHRARTSQEARRFSTRGTFFERLRRHLLAGILVIIPAFIAAYAVIFIMNAAEAIFGDAVLWVFGLSKDDPQTERFYFEMATKILSFLIACFVVITVGYLSTFFLVRRVIVWGEGIVGRVPLVKFFYNTPKEVLHTFTASRRNSFKRVVLVEYPRKGLWCLAFATGEVLRRPDNQRMVAIFLPTTPNPTSGFLIYVNVDEVYDTNIPVEQGARMIISGGILSPSEICTQKFSGLDDAPNLPPLGPLTTEVPDPLLAPVAEPAPEPAPEPVGAEKNRGE